MWQRSQRGAGGVFGGLVAAENRLPHELNIEVRDKECQAGSTYSYLPSTLRRETWASRSTFWLAFSSISLSASCSESLWRSIGACFPDTYVATWFRANE